LLMSTIRGSSLQIPIYRERVCDLSLPTTLGVT
jgi:hypothetical protein